MNAKQGGQKRHYKSLSKRLRSAFFRASVFLGAGGMVLSSGEAKAATIANDVTPAHSITQQFNAPSKTDMSNVASFVSVQNELSEKDQKEIADLRRDFARTDLGKELLNFIDNTGIEISRKSSLDENEVELGQYDAEAKKIYMSRMNSRSVQLMSLAHEARHAWQNEHLDYIALQELSLPIHQKLSLIHFVEADAVSFSSYYMADRIAKGFETDFNVAERQTPSVTYAIEYADVIKENKDFDFTRYRISMLQRHLKELPPHYAEREMNGLEKELDYFEAPLAFAEKQLGTDFPLSGKSEIKRVSKIFTDLPTDQELYKNLRKLGGVDLTNTSKTSLTMETDDALIKFYTKLPFSRPLLKNDALLARYDVLQKRYADFLERLETVRHALGMDPLQDVPKWNAPTPAIASSLNK